ncbi:MAG: dTDP-4-dehydrorhamnose 3,5-epimerase [Phycisphaerales bacterium]|nr:dTDP-4-dehydrorhamnose 3,5-epimerase [Phycisphaerales bacterium]
MVFTETHLKGCFLVDLDYRSDNRGWFSRAYCKKEFATIEHTKEWVQCNNSFTKKKGSIRGMHYQNPPFAEIKMIRCLSGKIYDVVVDIRKHSPTFLQYIGVELSATSRQCLYIPEGFAHGFQTLEDDTETFYFVSQYYEPQSEAGLRYNDPTIGISWHLPVIDISDKDTAWPLINDQFKGV